MTAPRYLPESSLALDDQLAFDRQREDGVASLLWPYQRDAGIAGIQALGDHPRYQQPVDAPGSLPIMQTAMPDWRTPHASQAGGYPGTGTSAARPLGFALGSDASAPSSFELPSPSGYPTESGAPAAPSVRAGAPGPAPARDPTGVGSPPGDPRGYPPGGPIDNSSRAAFVASAWPHMLAAAGGNRDAAEMMLAAAISENGDVGTGKPFFANNFFGIKGTGDAGTARAATWEQTPSGPVGTTAGFAQYSTPQAGFGAFFDFLRNNSRYAPALAAYDRTGDATRLFADVNAAGYATDPQWASKVASIRASQVAPITGGLPDADAAANAAPSDSRGMPVDAYSPRLTGDLVPNQFGQAAAEGLSPEVAAALCGPAAAIAFARANGRTPTLTEAKQLGEVLGVWDAGTGMHGPQSEVALLNGLGVPSELQQGVDWGRVAQAVSAGAPVIVDTPGHYYVAQGYDPATGQFDFGQSAAVLRAARGRTAFRPEEIPGLGMGAPRSSIYMQRPGTAFGGGG